MAGTSWPIDLESHFRYLSGIFLRVGLMTELGGVPLLILWQAQMANAAAEPADNSI